MVMQYVNAIWLNDQLEPVGVPTSRLDLVRKRVKRKPMHVWFNGEESPVVIAQRDLPPWEVMK